MTDEIIIAGFGGQGIMLMGQILANAVMKEGKEVTFFPSYGPEMRGGTANCTVVISDEEIASPVVSNPSIVIALNAPSYEMFKKVLRKNGLLFANASLIEISKLSSNKNEFTIPATEIAQNLGNIQTTNIVMLGFFVKKTQIVNDKTIEKQIQTTFKKKGDAIIDLNLKAFKEGEKYFVNKNSFTTTTQRTKRL